MGVNRDAVEVRDASTGYDLQSMQPAVPPGYKRTQGGVIPNNWETRQLEQIADIRSGGTPSTSNSDFWNGGVAWCTPTDITALRGRKYLSRTERTISHAGLRASSAEVIPSNSVIMTTRATIGECAINTVAMTTNQGFKNLIPSRVDAEFLYYLMTTKKDRLIQLCGGSTFLEIGKKQLKLFEVALPIDLKEQRAIATALSDVDALLEGLDRLIAKKRDLKQAAMQQLLTGQTRLPGFKGEWKVKKLERIGNFLKGSGIKREESQTGSLPCVRYGEIYTLHNDVVRKFYSWISAEVADTAVRIKKGDLLFAGSGETKEEIGKCVALANEVDAYAGGDIVILRPSNADPVFMGYALNQPDINLQKSRFGQGDAVVHITASALSQVMIRLPSEREQSAIATILSDMDAEIEALEQRRAKTAAIKQAMMQELLTGRIRLVDSVERKSPDDKLQIGKRKANVHFKRSVFAAEIVDQLHQEPTFGHVKFEKVLFLAEHLCDVDTGSTYHRKAAGPYDNRALRSIDNQLRRQQWFDARKENGRYRYVPLQKRGGHKSYFDRYFSGVAATFTEIVETLRGLDTERCEIIATLFSAWSDLLRDHATMSDEMIVHEVVNNWHESKKRIPEDRWLNALVWMRENGYVPRRTSSS